MISLAFHGFRSHDNVVRFVSFPLVFVKGGMNAEIFLKIRCIQNPDIIRYVFASPGIHPDLIITCSFRLISDPVGIFLNLIKGNPLRIIYPVCHIISFVGNGFHISHIIVLEKSQKTHTHIRKHSKQCNDQNNKKVLCKLWQSQLYCQISRCTDHPAKPCHTWSESAHLMTSRFLKYLNRQYTLTTNKKEQYNAVKNYKDQTGNSKKTSPPDCHISFKKI